MRGLTRRDAVMLGVGMTAIVFADPKPAGATPSEASGEIAKFTGGRLPETGRVSIELPESVEDGHTVPLSIAVESPMTPADHVTDVLVVTDGNPYPRVATFRFSPMSGRAQATTRVRLAASENVIVVARMSDGRCYTARREIEVTVGGCKG